MVALLYSSQLGQPACKMPHPVSTGAHLQQAVWLVVVAQLHGGHLRSQLARLQAVRPGSRPGAWPHQAHLHMTSA